MTYNHVLIDQVISEVTVQLRKKCCSELSNRIQAYSLQNIQKVELLNSKSLGN